MVQRFLIVFITGMLVRYTNAQIIDSVHFYSSNNRATVEAITLDKAGNQYVVGYFNDSVKLRNKHPLGTYNHTEGMYISSFTPDGTLRFTKIISTNAKEHIKITTDDSGNLFLGTMFTGTSNLKDGDITGKITGGAGNGFFILKIGGAGEYKWHAWGSSSGTGATIKTFDFVLRNNSELFYLVSAKGDVPVRNSNGGSNTYTGFGNTSTGRYGMLVVKVKTTSSSAASASVKIGSSANTVEAYCLAEQNGKIVFTGSGGGTVDFDPGSGTADLNISNKGYFCALDSNLKYVWAVTMGSIEQINRIVVDAWGMIRGIGVESGVGVSHLKFCSLTESGQILRQYDEAFSSGFHEISEIIADRGGNIFVTGTFQGSGDFDPTSASKTGYGGTRTAFVVKYDSAFTAKWLVTAGSASTFDDAGNAVFLDNNNVLYWGGSYSRTLVFSGNPSVNLPYTVPAFGFIAHLTECNDFKPQISPVDTAVCKGESVTIKVNRIFGLLWDLDADTNRIKTITPGKSENFIAEVYDGIECYKTISVSISVNPLPMPLITSNGTKVSVAGSWSSMQWYFQGQLQNGQSSMDFIPPFNGDVYCVVKNANGCEGKSNTLTFNTSRVHSFSNSKLRILSKSGAILLLDLPEGPYKVQVFDMSGRKVFIQLGNSENGKVELTHTLFAGTYLVLMKCSGGEALQQMIQIP